MKIAQQLTLIGRAESVSLPQFGIDVVPARIDTGAKTSALGVSDIIEKDDRLSFVLFDPNHVLYTGERITINRYSRRLVANSTGHVEERYVIKTSVILRGRRVKASFTLANRSSQVYSILVGRNILRGKFLVDVKLGKPLLEQERLREITKADQYQADHQDKDSL
jgi:hypothetical protein